MLRRNHKESFKKGSFYLLCIVFSGACSLILEYKECDRDEDCSGDNLVCTQGYCVGNGDGTSLDSVLFNEDCTRVYGASIDDPDAFNQNTILLGSLLPTSGDLGLKGPKMEQGIELAVDEINQAGGILEKDVAVLFCDSATSSENSKRALQHLIDLNRIPAVIGPASSNIVLEAFTEVAKDADLLMMSPAATSPEITTVSDNDLLWRTAPSDVIQGAAIADYLLNDTDFERIAIVNRNDAYGNGLSASIRENLCGTFPCSDDALFYNSVYDETSRETDQSEIVLELVDFEPSITVVIGFCEDGNAFLELAAKQEINRFLVTDGLNTDELKDLDLTKNQFCQLEGTQPASVSSNNYQSFSLRFNSAYGNKVGSYSANAYDAVYLIGYAIAATNSTTPTGPEVAKGLKRLSEGDEVNAGTADWKDATQLLSSSPNATINYEGASGPLDFDENGEAPSDIEGWVFNIDENSTFSAGTLYTIDGTYTDVFSTGDRGEDCGQSVGEECETSLDCSEGDYCDKTITPSRCTTPPTGQGTQCTETGGECEGFEADYCEYMVSDTCLKQGCDQAINDCSDDRICCDFTWIGLPFLCVDKVASSGLCTINATCEAPEDCAEGTWCNMFNPLGGVYYCNYPPFGQGEPCEIDADCLSYAATHCDDVFTNTCLWGECYDDINSCSEGYHCCELSWLQLSADKLCMPETETGGHCPCVTNLTCREDEYCDRTLPSPACFGPPTGQGEPCTSQTDCASYEADYCDVDGSSTCLKECDVTYDNCSPGYRCCDFGGSSIPNLCIEADSYATDCV